MQQKEWQALSAHQATIAEQHMHHWFTEDPERFNRFSLQVAGILFDYSKNRIHAETLNLLINFAKATNLSEKISALFTGDIVNHSEQRPALHTALRMPETKTVLHNGKNVIPDIYATLRKMGEFTKKVRHKTWRGHTGKPIKHIVNIGIGGSHLGPLMTTHALKDFATSDLTCHFISNIDSAHLHDTLKKIDPETTLFIISSKSFSTLETMTNAKTVHAWLQQKLNTTDVQAHFVAVTANSSAAITFGIPEENIFTLWDWVGGRYSIWSAIGLPLALMTGMENFTAFLAGAHDIDNHFQQTEFSKNIPVIMALLGVWYINFFDVRHQAIVPYSHHLHYFRAYLQQLDMESNGKNISQLGTAIDFLTGPVMLGEQGCNGQHTFHQLLHQGQHLIPVDFILTHTNTPDLKHQDILISSALSQAQALMRGKTYQDALKELQAEGYSKEQSESLAPHKVISGNRPSNVLFLDQITPYTLGALIALYEHKVFVQGAIWGINSFDQWGVELGKTLLPCILNNLYTTDANHSVHLDSSTEGLIQHYKNIRNLAL